MKANSTMVILFAGLLVILVLLSGSGSSAKMAEGPFNLVASDSGRYVQLNWDTDFGSPVRGYNIYRSVGVSEKWERLNDSEFSSTTFVDFFAPRPELLFYRVNYVNPNGDEASSSSVVGVSTATQIDGQQPKLSLSYNKNNVITESQLTNAGAMSVAQIQSFLDGRGSVLATYSSGGKTAAQRIYDDCQTHGISPYVVLVTLQKEKGLIASATANPNSLAMGWNTADSSTSDFANQIYYGTRLLRRYFDNLGSYGWTVGQSHDVSDGTVAAANTATAGLYVYTPWIGQGGGGQTGVGGNYLFWDLWTDTFRFTSDLTVSSVFPTTVITSRSSTSPYATTKNAFWVSDHSLAGQCTWYAYGRVIELSEAGYLDASAATRMYNAFWNRSGRDAKNWPSFLGGEWVSTNNAPLPIEKRKPGMLAVWPYGTNGHVGFVEEISVDKTRYRLTDFNRGLDQSYRSVWYNFVGSSDLLLGGYPSFYQLPLPSSTCSFSVGQGSVSAESSAFRNAFDVVGGQTVLGCATAAVRFDGFTSFAGTVGHYQTFANGDIEYLSNGSRAGQAYALIGAFSSKWASLGYTNNNPLGYPIGVLSQSANSCYGTQNRYQSFEGGSLNQHLSGAKNGQLFEVHGAIHRRWELGGFAICPLGMPITDETQAQPSGASGSSGRLSQFEGGQIYWKTNASAAYEVHGAIYSKYVSLGGSASWLGFPTANEFVSNGRARSDFEAGYITTLDGINYEAFSYGCPSSPTATPSTGSVGTTVTITGNNLTGVSSVKFTNNVSAQFTVNSDTRITTIVPSGATTGPITLGKNGCSNTQTNNFTVPVTISVTVTTNPSGRSFTVDEVAFTSSQTFAWQAGSSHSIATSSPQGNSETRYIWNNWSDSGAISHNIAATTSTTYTANFTTQHFLTMNAGTGGTVDPPSNWFTSGQSFSISASPAVGFSFGGWSGTGLGSFTGSTNPANVIMNGPITQTASFMVIPTHSLTVASSNPGSGVAISVSPNDKSGIGNGTTQFTRTYNKNTSVTLTAPLTAGGNSFQKWQRDGVDWITNHSTNVVMDVDHTMTAVYVTAPPSTVQLNNISYAAAEGGSTGTVTVVRLGNTSGATTVNYTTSDAAAQNNCGMTNGVASSRCDYASLAGTITFAAGESSKSVSIPIVDDSYAEGGEVFTFSLSNPSGALLGSQTSATVTINDNEIIVGPNPITQTAFFVRQHYIDFLGREPDPAGFAAWQSTINNCPVGTITCDRIHVSGNFFQSQEFQQRGYFVYRFYSVSFGRKPEYVEFIPDLAKVSGFLSDAQLEAAKLAFIAEFMNRPAFVVKFNRLTNTQYVDTLLSTAGMTHTARDFWIVALGNGSRTRAQVFREIAESNEVSARYYNQAFVVMQYFGYLRRDPDALHSNWIAHLNATGDYRSMINGFMNSLEYRFRFGP